MDTNNNLPKSRKEAKIQNSIYYFTGLTCGNGHQAKRITCSAACTECARINGVNYRIRHYSRVRNRSNEIQNKNRKGRRRAESALQRANKLSATPSWANLEAINKFYIQAKNRAKMFVGYMLKLIYKYYQQQ